MTPDQLEHAFRDRSLYSGTILILRPSDALELIGRAQQARLPILGLDGFLVTGDSIQPSMAISADYSAGVSAGDDTWAAARRFVNEHAGIVDGLEVVLGTFQAPVA